MTKAIRLRIDIQQPQCHPPFAVPSEVRSCSNSNPNTSHPRELERIALARSVLRISSIEADDAAHQLERRRLDLELPRCYELLHSVGAGGLVMESVAL